MKLAMRRNNFLRPSNLALLVTMASMLIALLNALDLMGSRSVFFTLSVLLLMYLGLEVRRLRRVHPHSWLLNPIVLCSFVTFVLGYGVTNILFYLPAPALELVGLVPEVSAAMVKLMWLVLMGAVAMWLGYWSPLAKRLSSRAATQRFQSRYLPNTNILSAWALPGLFVVSIIARFIQIRLGVFGYSATYDQLIAMGSITQYLALGSGLGKLALLLAALSFFRHGTSKKNLYWFYGLLVIEVSFGFLSGFKSAVVMPFVTVAICQYLQTGRLSRYWIVLFFGGLFAAYAVIEPFRAARNDSTSFSGTSVVSIASTMAGAAGSRVGESTEQAVAVVAIASRSNLSYVASFGIEFADRYANLPAGSPNFLGDLILAPLHAWIPRLIWNSKPLGNLGLWYNQEVMGMSHFSATAMGPFTYLYFAGGFIAVVIGFFFIGVVQRCLFFLLQPSVSLAGGAIFLAMLGTVVAIASSFNGIIITLCRELPLLLLMQWLLFRRRPRSLSLGNVSLVPSKQRSLVVKGSA